MIYDVVIIIVFLQISWLREREREAWAGSAGSTRLEMDHSLAGWLAG